MQRIDQIERSQPWRLFVNENFTMSGKNHRSHNPPIRLPAASEEDRIFALIWKEEKKKLPIEKRKKSTRKNRATIL